MGDILHVDIVLQHSEALCCTWSASCNIRRRYVARGHRLAIFGGAMLHVDIVLQHSEALCCTWDSSCNIRVLLLSLLTKRVNNSTLIATSHQTCQQRHSYCHFLPNVSTIISQQHHNYALPYTSFTTSPVFLLRYSILTNIYINKDLFFLIRKLKGPFSY